MEFVRSNHEENVRKAQGFQDLFSKESKRQLVTTISNTTAASLAITIGNLIASSEALLKDQDALREELRETSVAARKERDEAEALRVQVKKLEATIRGLSTSKPTTPAVTPAVTTKVAS